MVAAFIEQFESLVRAVCCKSVRLFRNIKGKFGVGSRPSESIRVMEDKRFESTQGGFSASRAR